MPSEKNRTDICEHLVLKRKGSVLFTVGIYECEKCDVEVKVELPL